jgi:hypothetical protein
MPKCAKIIKPEYMPESRSCSNSASPGSAFCWRHGGSSTESLPRKPKALRAEPERIPGYEENIESLAHHAWRNPGG